MVSGLAVAPAVDAAATPSTAQAAKQSAPADSPELRAFQTAIRQKYQLKERAFAAHDAETIVSKFYTEDVISVGSGEGVFVGREQIRPLYGELVKGHKIKIESVFTYVNGDAGWDWADFHVTPDDPKQQPFTLAILFLWTKVNGEWMCKGDFFTAGSLRSRTLAPPPPAAEPKN